LAVLGLSYANALRTYLSQQRDIAVLEAETSAKAASIAELEDEIARWDDPDYVRAQARARLGWVLPGETGYQVIGADGQLVASPAEQTAAAETSQEPWYERVWASLKAADVADLAVEDGPALAPGAAETPR
jgi:hypothetical protein